MPLQLAQLPQSELLILRTCGRALGCRPTFSNSREEIENELD